LSTKNDGHFSGLEILDFSLYLLEKYTWRTEGTTPPLCLFALPFWGPEREGVAGPRKANNCNHSDLLQICPSCSGDAVPRPKKQRHCAGSLCARAFKPTRIPLDRLVHIHLMQDELEALRLCDLEGRTQEEAGRSMGISRGTVQRIVSGARRKVAQALVEGAAILIAEDSPSLPGEE
jgi:uncharacterized protein